MLLKASELTNLAIASFIVSTISPTFSDNEIIQMSLRSISWNSIKPGKCLWKYLRKQVLIKEYLGKAELKGHSGRRTANNKELTLEEEILYLKQQNAYLRQEIFFLWKIQRSERQVMQKGK